MVLSIKNDEADRLARQLAALTGESLTDAVVTALRERIDREQGARAPGIAARLRRLAVELDSAPVEDGRPADLVLGYDEDGLPS